MKENVFEDLMKMSDDEVRDKIENMQDELDIRGMNSEYNELKQYFRKYKKGEHKLESDEDKKEHNDKLSRYFKLQKEIREEQIIDGEFKDMSDKNLEDECKRLSVFYVNSEYIKWAKEKIEENEAKIEERDEAKKEKAEFEPEGEELREIKKEIMQHKSGEKTLEPKELGEKMSRYLELNAKKKRIDKKLKDAQNSLDSIEDKEIKKAIKIMEIVSDKSNWDKLMDTPLDNLLDKDETPKDKGKKDSKNADAREQNSGYGPVYQGYQTDEPEPEEDSEQEEKPENEHEQDPEENLEPKESVFNKIINGIKNSRAAKAVAKFANNIKEKASEIIEKRRERKILRLQEKVTKLKERANVEELIYVELPKTARQESAEFRQGQAETVKNFEDIVSDSSMEKQAEQAEVVAPEVNSNEAPVVADEGR